MFDIIVYIKSNMIATELHNTVVFVHLWHPRLNYYMIGPLGTVLYHCIPDAIQSSPFAFIKFWKNLEEKTLFREDCFNTRYHFFHIPIFKEIFIL